MRSVTSALILSLALAGRASATDLEFVRGVTQDGFKSLAKEAGSALSYKNTAPAAPLGLVGFDVGVEVTAVDVKQAADYWKAISGNDAPSYLVVPKLRARKGLPFGIDVGAMYSVVPSSNVQLLGGEVSKALLDGSVVLPAIGIRATYTRLLGVDSLALQTAGLDASISKGFLVFTPYLGAGALWIDAKAKGKIVTDPTFIAVNGGAIKEEKIWQTRFFGGVKVTPLPFFGITGEVEYSGMPTYSLKLALSF